MVTSRAEAARDPAGARRRILAAAVAEFARAGFAGARVDGIARRAGVNKRMLYHYFGDKRALHRAVLDGRLGGAAHLENGAVLDAVDVRLLLWALLEDPPAAERLTALSRHDVLPFLVGLLAPPARPGGTKPRVRLKATRG